MSIHPIWAPVIRAVGPGGRTAFSRRTEPDISRPLAEEISAFIGRERELSELRELAGGARALTLSGPGGIGKTRLAVRLLAGLEPGFPGGAWFVDLAELRRPDLVESRIAAVLGVVEEPGRPVLGTLEDVLRPLRALLVLDNCEHVIDSCALACQRLLAAAPELKVIATSREPLRIAAETVWPVPPLGLPPEGEAAGVPRSRPGAPGSAAMGPATADHDALLLFADRAAAVRPGFELGPANLAAVTRICRALDGLPLAIELAAARIRVLSAEQIASRLDDRFALLGTGDRTAPPRQRTLRATIDWSYDLLSPAERLLARRFSALAGAPLEMAEELCSGADLPARDVWGLLAALADRSLITAERQPDGRIRYRMLETIREYSRSRLAESGEAELMAARLREYTQREVERLSLIGMAQIPAPWSASLEIFRRHDAENGNLRQVLGQCLDDGDAEAGLRVCAAVRPVWIVRGTFAEGAQWLDAFLSLPQAGVPAGVRGAALVSRGQLALASDPAAAVERASAGLSLSREAGAEFWTGSALNLLAEAALHGGRAAEAAAGAEEALAVARAAGDRWNEGYAIATQAAAAGYQGDLAGAERLATRSLEIMREIDQQWGVARSLLGLADLARLTGDHPAATNRYAEALAILRELGARPEIARCLAGLGRIALSEGDLAAARWRLSDSLELSRSTGSRIGVIRGLEALAALAAAEKRLPAAVQLVAAASALREAAGLTGRPGGQARRVLAAAAGLGRQATDELWAAGTALDPATAMALGLEGPEPLPLRDVRSVPPPSLVPGQRLPPEPAAGRAAGLAPELGAEPQGRGAAGAAPGAAVRDRGRTDAPAALLTARERQIAGLVALGLSNKEIGRELYISGATAARHVANIMLKLGYTTRAQIAAWAVRRGL